MAKLYATVTNERNINALSDQYGRTRGRVTQCAHKEQTVHICGWESGIRVHQFVSDGLNPMYQDGQVVALVYLTGGSNGGKAETLAFETVDGMINRSYVPASATLKS